MVIEIQTYGALKQYGNLKLEFSEPIQVCDLKVELKKKLFPANDMKSSLIDSAALATAARVLSVDETIKDSCVVVLLPPVCGG